MDTTLSLWGDMSAKQPADGYCFLGSWCLMTSSRRETNYREDPEVNDTRFTDIHVHSISQLTSRSCVPATSTQQ